MSLAASRDIAPDFINLLTKLPDPVLNEMESSFTARITKKKNVTPACRAILQSFQDEKARRLIRQHKTVFLPAAKKCLHCNTYHPQDKQHCPECGRFLYACGDVYQPKAGKKVQR